MTRNIEITPYVETLETSEREWMGPVAAAERAATRANANKPANNGRFTMAARKPFGKKA